MRRESETDGAREREREGEREREREGERARERKRKAKEENSRHPLSSDPSEQSGSKSQRYSLGTHAPLPHLNCPLVHVRSAGDGERATRDLLFTVEHSRLMLSSETPCYGAGDRDWPSR